MLRNIIIRKRLFSKKRRGNGLYVILVLHIIFRNSLLINI